MGAEVILQPTLTKTVDREQELVMARANAIVNQVYLVNPNYGGLFGTGRSVIVDPEGIVLATGGSGEELLTPGHRPGPRPPGPRVRHGRPEPDVEAVARRAAAGLPGLSRWLRGGRGHARSGPIGRRRSVLGSERDRG